jgi:hypothetical protein
MLAVSAIKGRLTRSSPIGPAEHDEGGSLVTKGQLERSSVQRSLIRGHRPPLGQDFDPRDSLLDRAQRELTGLGL